MSETNETSTETKVDLSHLAGLRPVETEFRTTRRGRTPGSNPMDVHVRASFESGGKALALPITAGVAKGAERQTRRAGVRLGYKMSVQILGKSPDVATADDVITLAGLEKALSDGTLERDTDVWLVLKAEPKPAKAEKAATETDADPFKDQPETSTETSGDETGKATGNGAAKVGKGRKVAAVANP